MVRSYNIHISKLSAPRSIGRWMMIALYFTIVFVVSTNKYKIDYSWWRAMCDSFDPPWMMRTLQSYVTIFYLFFYQGNNTQIIDCVSNDGICRKLYSLTPHHLHKETSSTIVIVELSQFWHYITFQFLGDAFWVINRTLLWRKKLILGT